MSIRAGKSFGIGGGCAVAGGLICLWLELSSLLGNATPAEAEAGSRSSARHERGWSYTHDEQPAIPWSIHVFTVDRADHEIAFSTTLGQGRTLGMSTVSEQVKRVPPERGQILAAVNGDFYNNHERYPGDPRDLQIHEGALVSGPAGHTCFWIDAAGAPQMTNVQSQFQALWSNGAATPFGLNEERSDDSAVLYTAATGLSTRTSGGIELVLESATETPWLPLRVGQTNAVRVREIRRSGDSPVTEKTGVLSIGPGLAGRLPVVEAGTVLRISTETVPSLAGVTIALGGGPALVRNGKAGQWHGLQIRHPRTALGWNRDHFFLVEVDGRQGNLSVGMTFPELAAYMLKLGCDQAMNLDGGGSATLWAVGNVMNSPSEGQERPGANALIVVRQPAASSVEKNNRAPR